MPRPPNIPGRLSIPAALNIGGAGRLSSWEDRKFVQRLHHAAFTVEVERVRGRLKKGGSRRAIFLGHSCMT